MGFGFSEPIYIIEVMKSGELEILAIFDCI